MKRIVKLPVFYLCLVCGGVLVLYLHNGQDTLTDILQVEGNRKLPSIQVDIKQITYKPDQDTPEKEASKPARNTPAFLTSQESSDPTPDTSETRRAPAHSPPEKLPEKKDEDDDDKEEEEEKDKVTAPSPLPSPPPPPARKEEEEEKMKGLKTILVWNNGYGMKRMGLDEGQTSFLWQKCEINTCYITANRSYLPVSSFDAVIFHLRATTPQGLPKTRSPKQHWIMFEVESASYIYQDLVYYDGVFNWTMTYRLDSDIPFRYGRIDPIKPPSPSSLSSSSSSRNYAEGKTKLAAWFVSNCLTHSRREKIVRFMRDLDVEVDIYGKCGKLKCARGSQECYGLLDKQYKFYLSFENSLCKDYVTEKLFTILGHDVVPVVFGLANYTAIAPPHSIINVLDFSSVRGLVDYLKYLDKNDDAYNSYFRWKERYRVLDDWEVTKENFCALCKKLHQDKPKVYWNMKSWFVKRGKCKRAHSMPLHSLTVNDPLMEKYEILIKDKSFEEFLMV